MNIINLVEGSVPVLNHRLGV